MPKIILKKSAVATKAPVAGDLDYGELALNYADGKLYYKSTSDTIESIGSSSTPDLSTASIDDLGDVDTTTTAPTDGQALVWDNANSLWIPGDVSSGDMTKTVYDSNNDGSVNAADYAAEAGTVAWSNITSVPSFATVATSGSYTDLTNKPTFKTIDGNSIEGSGNIATANTTYSISAETSAGGSLLRLTGSDSTTDDVKLAAGTDIQITRTDANTITITSTASGGGGGVTTGKAIAMAMIFG